MAETTRTISVDELLTLARDGAQIRTEHRPTIIAQFDELVAALKALIDSNTARAEAELARNQTQLEVLATMQATIRQQNVIRSQPLDLTPLNTVLTEIQTNTEPRPLTGYEFEVTARDRLGDIEKLRVLPISPTHH